MTSKTAINHGLQVSLFFNLERYQWATLYLRCPRPTWNELDSQRAAKVSGLDSNSCGTSRCCAVDAEIRAACPSATPEAGVQLEV